MQAEEVKAAILEAIDNTNAVGRFQKNRIRRILNSPVRPIAAKRITDEVSARLLGAEMLVVIEAVSGAGEVVYSIEKAADWNQILAFIERLLPLILQLISLFG